ncbi:saxitoxin and tetrodotoxin-binding protein 1 isoform X2 [Esox lucius]|uniref:saxitoxin and tetrodotoxin-binding protein 1 isoform X2 n=1 Tax=Esox lucius TaxID=8010 RepID=UPI000577B236|nr:saxitoxin and tetrodotoxin-binding protein 1 isoform X2 [Esox lucius]
MSVLYVFPLLVLFSVGTVEPEPQDCEDLVKPVALEDKRIIFGDWIFLEGFGNLDIVNDILRKTKSSWIQILPTSDNETALLNQGNLIFQATHDNVSSTGRLLQTCPDCLTMQLSSVMEGQNVQCLYIFGKNRTLLESDLKYFRTQAQCLQYPQPAPYSYDGVTEFCAEENKRLYVVETQKEKVVLQ